ncbi:MAG: hypothetical protein ACYDCS_09325 [Candidatus Dormibacteria bacterium]
MSTNSQHSAKSKYATRRRIFPKEEATWLQAAEAGDPLATIAERASVDIRTVKQHVDRARIDKELAGVRLSMVQVAADLHQQDMLAVAAALEAVLDPSLHSLHFSLEQTGGEIRVAGKRYEALVRHTKGSGLPHALSLWGGVTRRYATAIGQLSEQLEVELAATKLDLEGTSREMLGRLGQCASYGTLPPDELAWRIQGGDLRKGAFRILADVTSLDDPRAVDAQRQYAQVWTKISGEALVTDLCDLQADGQIRDRVRDLLEDLRLRRYLGHAVCPWCPGSLAAPRRRAAAASSRALGSRVVARAKRSR